MNDRKKAAAIRRGISALRDRATAADRRAKVADRLGAVKHAAKERHSAKLDRMLADQQERGLASGAYLAGRRQHPAVEEQCGCKEFCR